MNKNIKKQNEEKLNKLENVIEKDIETVKTVMEEIVPTYKPVN